MTVRIEPWTDADLAVLFRQNAPQMMEFLGGPETDEKVRSRHEKFLRESGSVTWPFTIRVDGVGDADGIAGIDGPVGSVVYWQTEHHGEPVYEMGWAVIDTFQGSGYGVAGVRLALQHAAAQRDRDVVWAFPRVDNGPSNGIPRSVGFVNTGEEGFEYPKGVPITVNAWSFDLRPLRPLR